MSRTMEKETREVKEIVGFRPAELAPLLNVWLSKNPGMEITDLIKRSIRRNPEIQQLAGKRYAHLLASMSACLFFCLSLWG